MRSHVNAYSLATAVTLVREFLELYQEIISNCPSLVLNCIRTSNGLQVRYTENIFRVYFENQKYVGHNHYFSFLNDRLTKIILISVDRLSIFPM